MKNRLNGKIDKNRKITYIFEETIIKQDGKVDIRRVQKTGEEAKKEIQKHSFDLKELMEDFFNHIN